LKTNHRQAGWSAILTLSNEKHADGLGDKSSVLIEVLHVLIDGLKVHPITGNQPEYQKFQESISALEQNLERPLTGGLVSAAGEVVTAMRGCNEQTPQRACVQPESLPSMLAMAAQSANSLRLSSEHCTQRLGEIEEQIEEASALGAVRALRFGLLECLQRLREQAAHQREKMAEILGKFQEQLGGVEGRRHSGEANVPSVLDTLTGLEVRASAERALADAMGRGSRAYAALFVVDRLHLMNARYGYSTGDQILRRVSNHLASCLTKEVRVFRWTGPAFVALMEQPGEGAKIREEIDRITSAKLNVAVQIGNGSIMLPIPIISLLLSLPQIAGLAELTQRIDGFIAEQARH
jgi:GGDEF domain-containing protein